ncbi:MAG TPA: carboxypeptidase-like regulatory domain-containing protein [Gemmataceae bacterium]|nr:carboxypeptidase-like regulatory domain-containing protein [Gemmataceae bacterium]
MDRRTWLRRTIGLPLLAAGLTGCDADAPLTSPAAPPVESSTQFDPNLAGDVAGRVTWTGEVPTVPPFQAPVSPLCEQVRGPRRDWPNPNAPLIDPQSRAVGGAVVFLRDVDPRQARPWDHAPVQVDLRDYQIRIRQGAADGFVGFVRRGDAVALESKQHVYQAIQARGADFFALTFPDEGTKRDRVLDRGGLVELSSNAGQFWMRAYLFVDDHPYFTRTDAAGRYVLPKAPPGRYDLVCWMPDWREASHEIDADTRLVTRLTFRPPLQVVRRVHVQKMGTATVDFTLSLDQFEGVTPSAP